MRGSAPAYFNKHVQLNQTEQKDVFYSLSGLWRYLSASKVSPPPDIPSGDSPSPPTPTFTTILVSSDSSRLSPASSRASPISVSAPPPRGPANLFQAPAQRSHLETHRGPISSLSTAPAPAAVALPRSPLHTTQQAHPRLHVGALPAPTMSASRRRLAAHRRDASAGSVPCPGSTH